MLSYRWHLLLPLFKTRPIYFCLFIRLYTNKSIPHLAVQQQRDLLAEIFHNSIRASLDLQPGRNSMEFDIRLDRLCRRVNLLSLFVCPHRGAELMKH